MTESRKSEKSYNDRDNIFIEFKVTVIITFSRCEDDLKGSIKLLYSYFQVYLKIEEVKLINRQIPS